MSDFGFLTGTWDIVNRRRTDFLDPASQWEEVPGISLASRHFDGGASFDEITFPTKGFSGLTLRLYNPDTGRWSLHWASTQTGTPFPPVTGAFKDGTGEFLGGDTCNGVPILARFRWTDITAGSARWEQAFSVSSGETWLDNWYMDHLEREIDGPEDGQARCRGSCLLRRGKLL